MKINSNFILKKTAGTWVAMMVGPDNQDMEGVLTLNESGAMLWKALEQGCEMDDLVRVLIESYDIDAGHAADDVSAFLDKLRGFGCIE